MRVSNCPLTERGAAMFPASRPTSGEPGAETEAEPPRGPELARLDTLALTFPFANLNSPEPQVLSCLAQPRQGGFFFFGGVYLFIYLFSVEHRGECALIARSPL